jgi:chromosome segregation ATPase
MRLHKQHTLSLLCAAAIVAFSSALVLGDPPAPPHPVTEDQLQAAAREVERTTAERDRLQQRLQDLEQRQHHVDERIDTAQQALDDAAQHTAAALAQERHLAALADLARQQTSDAWLYLQREQRHLDNLRHQQRQMLALNWVTIELRPAADHSTTQWLRNTNRSASIRITFRRAVISPVLTPAPPATETTLLRPGQELLLGSRRPTDRIVHEAAIIGAEWERGRPPAGIDRISSAQILEAQHRIAEAQRFWHDAAAAEKSAADAHARAAAALRAARAAQTTHERALATEQRALERIARDRQLTSTRLREINRLLAAAQARYDQLLKALNQQTQPR